MFREAGFEVVEAKTDLGNLEFKRVAREFTAVARDSDIAVLFYAGHGIEVNGTNYLIPVDAKLATDFDVEDEVAVARPAGARAGTGQAPAPDHSRCLPRQSVHAQHAAHHRHARGR